MNNSHSLRKGLKKRDIKSYLFFSFYYYYYYYYYFIIIASKTHTEKKQKLHGINKVIKRRNKNKNKTNSEFTHYFDISKYIAM